jgi:potassium-transporting ATPase KdpC subunit
MNPRSLWRTYGVALRALVLLTVITGLVYPLVITGAAQVVAPAQAHGSMLERDGEDVGSAPVGSALIGQGFVGDDGAALPEWFQSRPSAAGDGWDGAGSSGSNLGPTNPDLAALVEERRAAVAELEGVDPDDVPADALYASASGLDPHISPEYALLQVDRVADARGLEPDAVRALVEDRIQAPDLGFLGQPTVNVLDLNLAVAGLAD